MTAARTALMIEKPIKIQKQFYNKHSKPPSAKSNGGFWFMPATLLPELLLFLKGSLMRLQI
ncbi:hypothetical protein ABE66_08360 [Cytobacillus firmus]|nr:hypothetical protein [Cytobacillus firmus]